MNRKSCLTGVVLGFLLTLLAFPINAQVEDELADYTGDYSLVEQHCPAGIANSINVGIYDGIGVVKTSLGYLFSINMAGGSVIIKNGPTTVCRGTVSGTRFSGACMDNNRNFCAVVYQKKEVQ